MSILQTTARRVKNTRPARFGAGILPTRPVYRADFSASDSAWLVEDNARREAADRAADLRYVDSLNLSRLESGCY